MKTNYVSQCCILNKEQKNFYEVGGYGAANGRIWKKKDKRVTISEHKQYFE